VAIETEITETHRRSSFLSLSTAGFVFSFISFSVAGPVSYRRLRQRFILPCKLPPNACLTQDKELFKGQTEKRFSLDGLEVFPQAPPGVGGSSGIPTVVSSNNEALVWWIPLQMDHRSQTGRRSAGKEGAIRDGPISKLKQEGCSTFCFLGLQAEEEGCGKR